jgi:hypothetical protein
LHTNFSVESVSLIIDTEGKTKYIQCNASARELA